MQIRAIETCQDVKLTSTSTQESGSYCAAGGALLTSCNAVSCSQSQEHANKHHASRPHGIAYQKPTIQPLTAMSGYALSLLKSLEQEGMRPQISSVPNLVEQFGTEPSPEDCEEHNTEYCAMQSQTGIQFDCTQYERQCRQSDESLPKP